MTQRSRANVVSVATYTRQASALSLTKLEIQYSLKRPKLKEGVYPYPCSFITPTMEGRGVRLRTLEQQAYSLFFIKKKHKATGPYCLPPELRRQGSLTLRASVR